MTLEQSGSAINASSVTDAQPRVLIVDDSRLMRAALNRLLSKTCQVFEAENGEKGWEALQANPGIELVFSDLSMPVVDGFELLRRVRTATDQAISTLPFVIITGHEDNEGMRTRALELGASDFVAKPFRSTEITARVKTHTEQRRDLRELRQELEQRATSEAITGLANTAQFTARCDQLLSLAQRHNLASACMLVQLDGFTEWAKTQPALESDQLLRQVAELLVELVRVEDATGYLGDGRFGLVLSGANHAGALTLGQRLARQLDALSVGVQPLPPLHIGISTPEPAQAITAGDLLRAAEADLRLLPRATVEAAAGTHAEKQPAELLDLQQQLEQTRQSLLQAEQAGESKTEQLRAMQESTRQQLAKAHQTITTLRTQLSTLMAKFRDYAKRNTAGTQQQTETELAHLRATLAEREEQLETEQTLRRNAQEMVALLQARQASAKQDDAASSSSKTRGFLSSRLFGRDDGK